MLLKRVKKAVNNDSEKAERSKRGRRSRNKGASFERTIAKKFKEFFGVELVRTPQSGGFVKKAEKADDFRGDIVSADKDIDIKLHIECKCCASYSIPKWIRQSEEDCPINKIPTVIFHKPNSSKDYIIIGVEGFKSLMKTFIEHKDSEISDFKEEWKQIKGYEDYYISNKGRIKSCKDGKPVNYLKPKVGSSGYLNISLCKNGKPKSFRVHKLVAEYFVQGKTTDKNVVGHKDGNKLNVYYTNLEWISYHSNNLDAYETGLKVKGENHTLSKLKDCEILDIRILNGFGTYNIEQLSNKFKVSTTTINRIISNLDYRNTNNLFIVCKNAQSWSLPAWLRQSESDCPKGKVPCVIMHKPNSSVDYITMKLEDFFDLCEKKKVVFPKGGKK